MNYRELIQDSNVFSALRDECNVIFDTNKRLPQQVFRREFAEYDAFEHGMITSQEFAPFLTKIARSFGDRAVNYMTLDPDPVEYYHKNRGVYGLASFEPSALIDNYFKVMSRDWKSADSFIARGGDVGVIWGSSAQWGIFCDRISWELCLMASHSPIDESIMSIVRKEAFQVSNYELNLYRNRPAVALEFSRNLAQTYPALVQKRR
jgi:hypothetical protein